MRSPTPARPARCEPCRARCFAARIPSMFMHRLCPASPRCGRPAGALFGATVIFLASIFAGAATSFAEQPHPTTLPTAHLLKLSDAVSLGESQVDDLETN